ncbi:MAG TPA: thioredoxin family protein [Candidatus Nitrosotalea sp.]|nr:thioredoxin family protein [Candidatus Nitrosotalea sp.]
MEHVKPEEFDFKVLGDNKKTVVLFYATWCPYCSNFKPTFESAKIETANKVGSIIDEDENPLWDRFNIQAVPTMIVFQNGKIISRRDAKKHVGLTKSDMDSIVKELA